MLTLTDNILILIFVMAASLLFMVGLNRLWPLAKRYSSNDLVGWQLSVLGTTYAVVLGFMMYQAWMGFGNASLNTDMEASALRNMFRLAEGLPAPQREQLERATRAYADAAVSGDWVDMAKGAIPEESHEINETMWKILLSVKATSPSESIAQEHAMTELVTLTTHRRTRLLQSTSHLPDIFWCVLLVGGVLTVISVSMFGSVNSRVHTFQVISLTLFITLVMLAIADADRPFQGWVHVSDYPFQRAQHNMIEIK
jgi:Protein of unknown function (DUF4239)